MDFLNNTDIVVAIGFVIFLGVLVYYKVPGLVSGKLDERAVRIRAELDEARALREEAQALLASYERKQKEVSVQADEIIAAARHEAERASEVAKDDIARALDRRMKTAGEQLEAAEQAAVRQIRDRAVTVAVAAAGDVIRERLKDADTSALIDSSIREVGAKLH